MTEPLAMLARWTGTPPVADEWMDGRATVLRYRRDEDHEVAVVTVYGRPAERLGTAGGIAATSPADAMHCAATAAADMAFRTAGANIRDIRRRTTELLADPAQLDWRSGQLSVDGRPIPARTAAVLDSAVAAYAESAHAALFIGVAARPPTEIDQLLLVTGWLAGTV